MMRNMITANVTNDPALNEMISSMIGAALNGIKLDHLYDERDICRALHYALARKYPGNKFIIQRHNGCHILATTGKIDDHVIHIRAAGLNIKSTPTRFEARDLADLFTCFILLDNAK